MLDVNSDGVGGDQKIIGAVESDNFFALYGDTSGDGIVGVAEFGSSGRHSASPRATQVTIEVLISITTVASASSTSVSSGRDSASPNHLSNPMRHEIEQWEQRYESLERELANQLGRLNTQRCLSL